MGEVHLPVLDKAIGEGLCTGDRWASGRCGTGRIGPVIRLRRDEWQTRLIRRDAPLFALRTEILQSCGAHAACHQPARFWFDARVAKADSHWNELADESGFIVV